MLHAPSHHPLRPWERGHPPRWWRSKVERETATVVQMEEVTPAVRVRGWPLYSQLIISNNDS